MTLGALGDDLFLFHCRWMATLVTIQTAHLCFVLAAVVHVLLDHFHMTFDTVGVRQLIIDPPDIALAACVHHQRLLDGGAGAFLALGGTGENRQRQR